MKGIDVIVEQVGSSYQVAVVRVLGQIDTTTSNELERRLQFLLKDRQFEIVIDLSKVSYISSAGWGIFISEIRGIRESGGDLKLAGMTPEVAEVFELLEFHNILQSFKTITEAVAEFEKPKPTAGEEQDSGWGLVSDASQEQGSGEARISAASEGAPVDGEKEDSEAHKVVGDGLPQGGVVASASDSAPPVQMSHDSGVATEVMETGEQTASGLSNEAELEIVDPANPDAKEQIRAEIMEEPRAVEQATPSRDPRPPLAEPGREDTVGARPGGPPTRGSEGQTARTRETDAAGTGTVRDGACAEAQETPAAQTISKELEQAILETVKGHPEFGCLKIRGELLRRGHRRPINPLSLFMELKRLNLETKDKRRKYAESFSARGADM